MEIDLIAVGLPTEEIDSDPYVKAFFLPNGPPKDEKNTSDDELVSPHRP